MFGIDSGELLLIVVVTVLVFGPNELPRVLYRVGQVMGKIRGFTQHFRTGIDAMVREVEMDELQKKWAADNERIMREHGEGAHISDPSTAALAAEAGADAFPAAAPADEPPIIPLALPDTDEPRDEESKPRPDAVA